MPLSDSLGYRILRLRQALGLSQAALRSAIGGPARGPTVVKWEKDQAVPPRGTLWLLADLTSDPEAVRRWLEHGGPAPVIEPRSHTASQEPAGRTNEGGEVSQGGVLLSGEVRGLHERQRRIAGSAARLVGGAVKQALELLPPGLETRQAIAEALVALARRLSRESVDVSGILTVEEMIRRGDL